MATSFTSSRKTQQKSERGDTIIEVLISLTIIALIITGAFMVSRTSSQHIRASQEHGEALGLLQGQVEMLRTAVTSTAPGVIWNAPSNTFCMDQNTGQAVLVSSGTACKVDNVSGAYTYDLTITPVVPAPNAGVYGVTYKFNVSWPSVTSGTNQESIVYRVSKI